MPRLRVFHSVVFQLVLSLVVGGLVMSAGLGVLELRRAEGMLQMEVTQHTALTTRNLQSVLRGLLAPESPQAIRDVLTIFLSDGKIRGARVRVPGCEPIEMGDWPMSQSNEWTVWSLGEHGMSTGDEVNMSRLTLVQAPFADHDRVILMELLIDGPAARRQLQANVIEQLGIQWLFLAMVVLMGLLLLRRWCTGPLSEIARLVGEHTGPEPFYRLARQMRGEFAQLAEAIGGMLSRLENTTSQLRKRERAFENLYQFAPAAMVSLDVTGKIIEANRRAAELLRVKSERELLGRAVLDFIRPEDRSLLRQTVDRLDLDTAARCDLRVQAGGRDFDVALECTGVRDEDGSLQSVRLSLLDVTESSALARELVEKSRLLNLIIDHMSDGILLVDAQGKIAACNQQLAVLMHMRPGALAGQAYDPERFWEELGVLNHDLFVDRLRQIDADRDRPAQERFEARAGTFLFQGIPVHDAADLSVGRLWVVQDITTQEQSQRLLVQQTCQLQAIKKMGRELAGISGLDDLLERAAHNLFEVFGVEALGLALRQDEKGSRSRQILHRGSSNCMLEPNRALMQATEKFLMPQILSNQDVTFWPELPRNAPWAKAFNQAGLTCLAACPLVGNADAQGILWIGRRGGERIERRHIYLLEALAPVIAARLEIAQMFDRMRGLELTDPVTDLPNSVHFKHEVRRHANRPGSQWAIVMLKLDHFRKLNELMDHEAADELLRRIGTLLRTTTRKSCLVTRLRGPLFGVLGPAGSPDGAITLARRLQQVLTVEPVQLADGTPWRLSASIGLVHCPTDGQDAEPLIELALARSEMARRSGRDRIIADGPGAQRQAG